MATITATNNQQFYTSCYPVSQTSVNLASNTANQGAYQHQYHHQHPHSHQQHIQQQQQQQHHQVQQQQHQHQQQQQQQHVQQQYQHQQVAVMGSDQTTNQSAQLGHQHQNQRTLSASTNSSAAAVALYNIEAIKSTKGASKLRRDLINTEIAQLRELLPLPASTRQRLSQLQLMALVLVYVRKSNYFCNAFRNYGIAREPSLTIPASSFSKALNGFLMMLTQKGKLLYISDNAAEYLGHSMEDLLSHGDEVYDIIEDQDKKTIRTELLSNDEDNQSSPTTKSLQQSTNLPTSETRIALCRMNVSRNARRQMRFGDQKVVLIEGHYFGFLPLSSRDEPVFLATCTPIAMPETRECVVQGSTNVFTSIHSMDMKFLYIDGIGEHHLGYTKQQIQGISWYELIHFDHLSEAQIKHKKITTNEQERSTIALLRMMNMEQTGYIWVHSVMQVKEATDTTTQPVIVCTNQVLSEREAQVMRSNSWLYQFYSLHSKAHCNFSSNSPIHVNQTETPNSVCSESDDCSDVKPNIRTTINASTLPVGVELAKSPPAAIINNGSNSNQGDSGSSPARSSEAFQAIQDNYIGLNGSANTANNTSYNGYQAASIQQHSSSINNNNNKNGTVSSKLSPITHSPSSSSNISSSPLSSSSLYPQQQQRYHQLTSSNMMNPLLSGNNQSTEIHHNHHSTNSVGSSSASSTSSSSSSSSTSSTLNEISTTPTTNFASHNVAQSMAVAAAAGSTAAASLYAGIEAIDPLQHMHHSAHHHTMYSAATGHQHHSSHTAAAVNYANQVMAAQRVAHQQSHHHHHHPYHPYHHHHHHQHQQTHSHHQSSHVAPHHHNHHTTPHALYAPSHHHVAAASTVALNSAFNHHHHAAAYHSAAAVAAATSAHPAHHHTTSTIENPYHQASAAAAAAAHQGVSFHKIVAAVNASA